MIKIIYLLHLKLFENTDVFGLVRAILLQIGFQFGKKIGQTPIHC